MIFAVELTEFNSCILAFRTHVSEYPRNHFILSSDCNPNAVICASKWTQRETPDHAQGIVKQFQKEDISVSYSDVTMLSKQVDLGRLKRFHFHQKYLSIFIAMNSSQHLQWSVLFLFLKDE